MKLRQAKKIYKHPQGWFSDVKKVYSDSQLDKASKRFLNWVVKNVRNDMIRVGEHCEICGVFVPDFEYGNCCDGRECGCMGKPILHCFCYSCLVNPEFKRGNQ